MLNMDSVHSDIKYRASPFFSQSFCLYCFLSHIPMQVTPQLTFIVANLVEESSV